MMNRKAVNDYLTGRADYYWNKTEIAAHTARIVKNEQGLKCLRDQHDRPIVVNHHKYVIIKDADYKEGNGERLVIGSRFAFHSTIAGGSDIKYGGYITTNAKGRKTKAKDADTCTGHYLLPFAGVAQNDLEHQQSIEFEPYKDQKFSEITDEQIEIDDNSTVALGLEPQNERIAAEFP